MLSGSPTLGCCHFGSGLSSPAACSSAAGQATLNQCPEPPASIDPPEARNKEAGPMSIATKACADQLLIDCFAELLPVCTENPIRVDDVTESPKLAE
jgi:hypothetical protein